MSGIAAERQAFGNALREPFLLKPAAKDYLWGGNRLNDDFGKGIDLSPLAETWECSTHPDGPSTIASGKFAGKLLPDFIEKHPEVLGTHPRKLVSEGLSVLIKFIDAKKDLSVQVHPDDEYARTHEGGQLGKTEMWYVLSASSGASLVYGFRRDVTATELRQRLEDGSIERDLQNANFGQMGRLIRTEGALVSVSSVRSTAPWVPSAGTIRHAC